MDLTLNASNRGEGGVRTSSKQALRRWHEMFAAPALYPDFTIGFKDVEGESEAVATDVGTSVPACPKANSDWQDSLWRSLVQDTGNNEERPS